MFCHVGILVLLSTIVHAFYPYTPALGKEIDYKAIVHTIPPPSGQAQRRDVIHKVCVEAYSGHRSSRELTQGKIQFSIESISLPTAIANVIARASDKFNSYHFDLVQDPDFSSETEDQYKGEIQLHAKRQTNVGNLGLTTPTSTIPSIISAQTPSTSNSLGINQDADDISYFSYVQFGSKNETFRMVIDTGSADTWLPSSTCQSKSCLSHKTYGTGDSTTLQTTSQSFEISYGSGLVSGVVASDDICLANFCLNNVEFGLSNQVSDDFINYAVDGILGLAMSQASKESVPTIIDVLIQQKMISKRIYGINLHRAADGGTNDGAITFGGFDESKIVDGANGVDFVPVISNTGLWNIAIDDVWMDNTPLQLTNRTVVLDTGTSLILLPPADALLLHKAIPGTLSNSEVFYIPCSTKLKLEFQFGGCKYQISSEDYVGDVVDSTQDLCLSHIVGKSVLQSGVWLVGDVFLKNVVTIFDVDARRVGFGIAQATSATATALVLPTDVPTNESTSTTQSSSATGDAAVSLSNTTTNVSSVPKNNAAYSRHQSHSIVLFSIAFAFIQSCLVFI